MKRAILLLRNRVWVVLLALTLGLLMAHEKALIDDGEDVVAEVLADTLADAARAKAPEVAP